MTAIADPIKAGHADAAEPSPAVAGLPIIDTAPPEWSRSVLTESQAAVESNLFQWRKLVIAAPAALLRPNAKLVALVVGDRCGAADECAWPSLERLEAETSLSRNAILRAVQNLEGRGFLAVVRDPARGAGRQSNRYYPAWPVVMEAEWHLRRFATARVQRNARVSGSPTEPLVVHERNRNGSSTELPSSSPAAPEVSLEVALDVSPQSPAAVPAAKDEREMRQTKKGIIAARWSDKFRDPRFTFSDAWRELGRFEPYADLVLTLDQQIIGPALNVARSPKYVITALERAYPQAVGRPAA